MRTLFLRVVVVLCVVRFAIPACAQDSSTREFPAITAKEATARLTLLEKSSVFSIELSADSPTPIPATLVAKVVDLDDKVLAEGSVAVQLAAAPQRAEVPLNWVPRSGFEDISSARLFYEVRLPGSTATALKGTVSPLEVISDLFELRFKGLGWIVPGHAYLARVWATRPNSDVPVPGVVLNAVLRKDDEGDATKSLKANAKTNVRGEAVLRFQIPEKSDISDELQVALEIQGRHGNFQNSVSTDLYLQRRAAMLLSTDKPLYQPEQTLHMRALLLNKQHQAWAKQKVKFTVHDPEDTIVFSSEVESSRFGIAASNWTIPTSQKLGDYRVTAEVAGDADSWRIQDDHSVRLSRYELPTFTVNVKPDKTYYLPGQNADLTVSAAYLFGKPVLRGHVRILREASRRWNYARQKWEAEESLAAEGDLDQNHEFHATLDLSKDHADLQKSDWERFEDVRFAAYLTEDSSRRTQERHFDVRVSRDDIHLYVLSAGDLPAGLPPIFYVTSSLANGTPAGCEITAQLFAQDPSDLKLEKETVRPIATTIVRTNRYGVAEVRFPLLIEKDNDSGRRYLLLSAKMLDGRAGNRLESYYWLDDAALRVTPTKFILKPGDPIEATIESSLPNNRICVQLLETETLSTLASQELRLSHGRAKVTFPYDKKYAGTIQVITYPLGGEFDRESQSPMATTAAVLFPQPHNLRLAIKLAKTTYRPGEAAAVNLQVRDSLGEATQGAMGLLVYDQALEELAHGEAALSTDRSGSFNPQLGFNGFQKDDRSIAGISVDDLLNRPPDASVPADLELLARALLTMSSNGPLLARGSNYTPYFSAIFEKDIQSTLGHAIDLLYKEFSETGHFPANDAEYAAILRKNGMDAAALKDPWERAYHVRRSYQEDEDVLEFRSEGPDKISGSDDDFTAFSLRRSFFEHDAGRMRGILDAYQAAIKGYVRDLPALRAAFEQAHTPLTSFVDPWGTPYEFVFGVEQSNYTITVKSAGPDKKFRPEPAGNSNDEDDLQVWVFRTPYFRETTQQISGALAAYAKSTVEFPENEEEFRNALKKEGIDWDALRDPWGRSYRVVSKLEAGYSDKITVRVYGEKETSSSIPVTHIVTVLNIVSDGPDKTPNTADDFTLARFASPFLQESGNPAEQKGPSQEVPRAVYSGNSGALIIVVSDPTGASVSGALLTATNEDTGVAFSVVADDAGVCLIANVPPGKYRVLAEKAGFKEYLLTGIPVLSSNTTNVEVTLQIGGVMESVEVSAGKVDYRTTLSTLSLSAARSSSVALVTKSGAVAGEINIPLATPRLREYFPETLLWQPEILTDRSGHTTVKVPLADSITTWKVSVIASTLEGHVATTSADLRAFQPFFAELDPPKVLTVGDEIHLPVTVRNYLEKPQTVILEWKSESWAKSLSASTAQVDVPAGDYTQKAFAFRAMEPAREARQRVTAFNRSSEKESDAIERKLRIHADGQERLAHANAIFTGQTSLTLDIPASALPGSIDGELVVYPNLIAHVADGIEGIMQRPYGCAEQTISSAYPSLLWLQLQKSRKLPASSLDARALRYLRLAYAKLLRYREPGGGISYWGKGEPSIPLTAYALRFVGEASEFVEIDPGVIASARGWLLQQASPEGAWMSKDNKGQPVESSGVYYTAFALQGLIRDLRIREGKEKEKELEAERQTMSKALRYLEKDEEGHSDPYAVALLATAKLSMKEDASKEIAALLELQHPENETVYWDAQYNTVFYGWGYAGRLETTALALEALAIAKQQGAGPPAVERALNLGTLFLLRNKDRYGVWYTTQATVNVLQCLVRQLSSGPDAERGAESALSLLVDGKPGLEFPSSADAWQFTPQRVNLTSLLGPGQHRIEIQGGSSMFATAYVNTAYYLPWSDPAVAQAKVRSGDAEFLRYSVQFDRSNVVTGDPVRCTVHAERVGFHGYGMMLAEVGLPPGAEVDRASLDEVRSTWDVQSYEIQPDRVVFYLWPRASGITFSFMLKARYAMNAQSAESILYDYYNPEARASVPPVRFVVQ